MVPGLVPIGIGTIAWWWLLLGRRCWEGRCCHAELVVRAGCHSIIVVRVVGPFLSVVRPSSCRAGGCRCALKALVMVVLAIVVVQVWA